MKLNDAMAAKERRSIWTRIYDALFGYRDRLKADWDRRHQAGDDPDPCDPGGPMDGKSW